jgi:hypothetical protein
MRDRICKIVRHTHGVIVVFIRRHRGWCARNRILGRFSLVMVYGEGLPSEAILPLSVARWGLRNMMVDAASSFQLF